MVNPAMALPLRQAIPWVVWWAVRPLQHSTPSQKLRVACVRLTKCRLAWRTHRSWRILKIRKPTPSLWWRPATVAPQMQNSFVLLSRQWLIARDLKNCISKLIWQQTISASWSMKRWKTMPRPIKRHPLILHRLCPSPRREQNRIWTLPSCRLTRNSFISINPLKSFSPKADW